MSEEVYESPLIDSYLVGSDPEVFIYAHDLGKIVPSLDKVGGSKDAPKKLTDDGFFVQEDNVLAEFNIPPAASKQSFISNINRGLILLHELVKPSGFEPLIKSSHRFEKEQLTDDRAWQMGCDPDYNAWTETINMAPNLDNDPFLRSGGGHVLVGYKKHNYDTNLALVKFFDHYLGVPSILLDTDKDRKKLYGKAGAHRHKEFGVEYRTLSSFWLGSDTLIGWVWDSVAQAISAVNKGDYSLIKDGEKIRSIIDTNDQEKALAYVEEHNLVLPI